MPDDRTIVSETTVEWEKEGRGGKKKSGTTKTTTYDDGTVKTEVTRTKTKTKTKKPRKKRGRPRK